MVHARPAAPGTGADPLFLSAGRGGEVLPYRDLVENLDSGLPVFGLRRRAWTAERHRLGTVEELAAHYVEEIRQIQPDGPYRLGGFCFSGLVAYEMARQLQAAGRDHLDARDDRRVSVPAVAAASPTLAAGRASSRPSRSRRAVPAGASGCAAASRGRVRRAVYFRAGRACTELLAARNLQRLIPQRPWNLVLMASNLARMRYVPKTSDVRVEFFRAQRAPGSRPTPWDDLATRGVDLRQIVAPDIDHASMMHEPHVQMLAERLMRHLDGEANGDITSDSAVPHGG